MMHKNPRKLSPPRVGLLILNDRGAVNQSVYRLTLRQSDYARLSKLFGCELSYGDESAIWLFKLLDDAVLLFDQGPVNGVDLKGDYVFLEAIDIV